MTTPFLDIRSVTDLCIFLGLSEERFNYFIFKLKDANYKSFEINKRSGGNRKISAPIKPIREMQEKISIAIKEIYKPRSHVTAYIKNRGFRYNAAIHQKKKWVAKIDLENFFPSIHFGRVQALFQEAPFNFPNIVAQRLAQVICFQKSLPQGGVTSPIISNLICRGLDHEIRKYAISLKCDYSRYCDDLVFSTNLKSFPDGLIVSKDGKHYPHEKLVEIMSSHKFIINLEKTRLYSRGVAQIVTGVVVNNGLTVKREYKKELRSVLHHWKTKGKDAAFSIYLTETFQRSRWDGDLTGNGFSMAIFSKIMHVGHIEGHNSSSFKKLLHDYCKLNPEAFKTLSKVLSRKPTKIMLYTEGYTDQFILEKAMESLRAKHSFGDLDIGYHYSPVSGFTGLLQCAQNLCTNLQNDLTIILFDRDIDHTRLSEVDSGNGYRKWGNNVYTVILPSVSDLKNSDICLETMFPISQITQTDSEGRRFYLRNEFNVDGITPDGYFKYSRPGTNKLLCDSSRGKVENNVDTADRKNYLLSKKSFAIQVKNENPPFDSMDFSNFVDLFTLIKSIKNSHVLEQRENRKI
jgi:RNA-directed DNA polymerase